MEDFEFTTCEHLYELAKMIAKIGEESIWFVDSDSGTTWYCKKCEGITLLGELVEKILKGGTGFKVKKFKSRQALFRG